MRLVPEMTYSETIAGPWGPTTGSPVGARPCWQVTSAELAGPRIRARLAMPGADWIRLGPGGIRRPDQRPAFVTNDDPDSTTSTCAWSRNSIREMSAIPG